MGYAKKNIGDAKTMNKEQLREYIKKSDLQNRISNRLIDIMLETPAAARVTKSTLKEEAISEELSRPKRAQRVDESKTAKTVKPITRENFTRWKRNPARFDLRGIDTKTHSLIVQHKKFKVQQSLNKGFKVKRRGRLLYRIEKGGRARDIITGRFISRR